MTDERRNMASSESEFYEWMCRHARAMGWDMDETDSTTGSGSADGAQTPRRNVFRIWAAIATTDGLTPEQTEQLARGLGVTPQEVAEAYRPEMRQDAMAEILAQPDLADLDDRLDQIADNEPPR